MIAEKLLADQNFSFKDGLFFQNQFSKNDFESTYIDIRGKEGRLFSDLDISRLPEVDHNHPHFNEWQIRKRSTIRLVEYLNQKPGSKNVLEIGCGNGWLSHRLSKTENSQVIGLDVNITELKQAAKVFQQIPNLTFIAGDVFTVNLPTKINYIVLASSAQYFPELNKLLNALMEKLSDEGEIHILDSPFYTSDDVILARERSNSYFGSRNSKMIHHYYHHTWDSLSEFDFEILYNPASILSKLKNKIRIDSPFPWIKIKKTHGK